MIRTITRDTRTGAPRIAMKLDDWLSQRSQSCPDRAALVADGSQVTYAELEAEATWVARRLAAHGVRRGSTVAVTMHPRREQVVLLHALLKLGATVLPLAPQMTPDEHAAIIAAEEADVDLVEPGELTQTEADLPLLGEHDMDDIACRVLTSGSSGTPHPVGLTYGNFLWSAVGSAFNIGVDPADRWLCCLPLSHISGLGIVMRSVIYGTTAVDPRRLRHRPGRRRPRRRRDHRALAGDDDAGPPARGRRRPLRAAGDPDRRRAGPRGAARRGDRARRHRGPDLRADRGLLAGDDPRSRRREAQARLRRAAAAHHPPADPGGRDPRPGPDRRTGSGRRRRLAPHRRPRPHRRRGLPLRRGPHGRHDRQRRRERRPRRSRAGPARATPRSPTPPSSAARTPSGSRR